MPNFLTLCFKPCEPSPAAGYQVHYRPADSDEDLRVWPDNFTDSPAQLEIAADPDGTQYEGFIYGDCGDGKLGVGVPFKTGDNPSVSASPSASVSESVPPPTSCGSYFLHNAADDDREAFPANCLGQGSINMIPGQDSTVCLPQTAPGVPTIPLPDGVEATYLGICHSLTGTLHTDDCFTDAQITEVRWHGFDVLEVDGALPVAAGETVTAAVPAAGSHTLRVNVSLVNPNTGHVTVTDSDGTVQCANVGVLGDVTFAAFVIAEGFPWSVTLSCDNCS